MTETQPAPIDLRFVPGIEQLREAWLKSFPSVNVPERVERELGFEIAICRLLRERHPNDPGDCKWDGCDAAPYDTDAYYCRPHERAVELTNKVFGGPR